MSNPHSIQLQTGELQISVLSARFPLETLLTFGSRLNPKRRFLFVSKVLGKYVPCLPSAMRETYVALASNIQPFVQRSAHIWVLGVAETATGLGAGVAREIKRNSGASQSGQQIIYSHTTRSALAREIDFSIEEAHSHAPGHLIYHLQNILSVSQVSSAVIVDDEISTGKTLAQLTENLIRKLPNLKTVVWTSLVNWMSEQERSAFARQFPHIKLVFCTLLDGTFEFNADPNFKDELPELTATGISQALSRADLGRTGYSMQSEMAGVFKNTQRRSVLAHLDKNTPYTVIGTGEFSFQPFLLAEQMQQQGFNVLFQSSGRSPAIKDCGINSKLSGFDEAHKGMFYLYNLAENRQPLLCYENIEQYQSCPFKALITAEIAVLDTFSANECL